MVIKNKNHYTALIKKTVLIKSIHYSNNEPVSLFSINAVSGDSAGSVVNIFLMEALLYIDTEDLPTDEALF